MSVQDSSAGFTILEVLVAVTIMAIAFAIVWSTFTAATSGWQRGTKLLDQLHQGDYVLEQIVTALRSAAFFESPASGRYGFRLEANGSGADAADVISWVTSGTGFLPPDSPLANGLHRLEVSLGVNEDGKLAIAIRAWPHLADEEEDVQGDPWFVSTEIQGFQCRTYNAEDEDWEHEWEDTNSIPRLVELTLTLQPVERYEEPQKLQRLVEIPIAPPLTKGVKPPTEAPSDTKAPPEGE